MELERTIIKETKGKLLRIKVPRQWRQHGSYELAAPDMHDAFAKKFHSDATYTFLRTVANPDAAEALKKAKLDGRGFFPSDLHDLYVETLHEIVPSFCNHVYYPLIENVDVHCLDRHADYPYWPVIHIVEHYSGPESTPQGFGPEFASRGDAAVLAFESAVREMNDDATYARIKKREAPQNYRIPAVDLLRKKRIPPLLIQDRTWTVEGAELRNAIDFLCQWQYTAHSTAPVSDAD